MTSSETEQWETGTAYEPYVGRWSRQLAPRFVEWLSAERDGRWLDVGCGTGALTEAILGGADPAYVRGVDLSEAYVGFARKRIDDPRAEFAVEDGQYVSGDGGPYDQTVSALFINFVPDPSGALHGMKAATRSGGTVGAYVWDYSEGMEMIRRFWDAAVELDPAAASLDEARRFPICRPDALKSLWQEAGLDAVAVESIEIVSVFRHFDDFWTPFLGGQGPAPSYVESLPESNREALKTHLQQRLPAHADGGIRLRTRAWAVRGRV